MMKNKNPRGTVLIVVLVAMAVLAVLALGVIAFTGTERDAAIQGRRGEQLMACAEVARAHVLAQLRAAGGMSPESIAFSVTLPDEVENARRSVARTGHVHDPDAGVVMTGGVLVVKAGMGAQTSQARDLTNVATQSPTLGGQYYRVVVACESGGRQREVEFLVRYGI
jgi:Tfp pilus assembly protein PilX